MRLSIYGSSSGGSAGKGGEISGGVETKGAGVYVDVGDGDFPGTGNEEGEGEGEIGGA